MTDTDKKFLDEDGVSQFAEETKKYVDKHADNADIHVTADDKANWNGKQGALTAEQLAAVNSGINATDKGNYDAHVANADIHVTTDDKANWNGKQDALTSQQLANIADVVNKANDSDVVHKTGDETISGVKTFASQIKGIIDKSRDYYLTDNTLASANGSLGTVRYYYYYPESTADLDTEIFEHSLWSANIVTNSIPNPLDSFYYIDQYFFSSRTATSNRIQILRGYRKPNLHMVRVYDGNLTNSWSEWVKFASDSDVVHKSGNETVSGVKTFSDGFSVNNTSPRLQTKSTTYSSEISSGMNVGDIAFLNKNGGFSSWIVDQLRDDLTKRLCFRVFPHAGGAYKGFAFDDNCNLYPENTNSALGTSTNKWKTINGVEPSDLSLPSDTYITIDTTDFAWGRNFVFTPSVNGHLFINIGSSDGIRSLSLKTGRGEYYITNQKGIVRQTIPVYKGKVVTILAGSSITETIVPGVWLYPLQGNV